MKTDSENQDQLPFVSVIMPVRNEAGFIQRSLGSVLAQDYPANRLEILVVDGMSTDRTRAAVAEISAANPRVFLLDNPGRIAPTGLNVALRRARGEILIRVDGHCEIAPDYVSRCVETLLKQQVECAGGPIDTIGETLTARAIALAMSSPFGVGDSAFRTVKDRSLLADTVAFPAYTRQAVEKVGFFDEELVRNQDDEYNYRLRKLGGRILLNPQIRSRYYSRSSLGSLWRQYFQYGYWKVRVMQKHSRQMRPRQFIPPAFVLALLGSALLALFGIPGRLLLAAVAGSYLAANLAASFRTAPDLKTFLLLPPIFAILHLSYGAGFLQGLIRFRRHWKPAKLESSPVGGTPPGQALSEAAKKD